MRELHDRVAVVTGAASGIGRAMAQSFVAVGMKVVLADIQRDALEATAGELRHAGADVHAVTVDVTQPQQVEALAAETLKAYGAVHVLCNNAGVWAGGPANVWTVPLDDWRWVLDVNLMGVVHGLRTFLPLMIEQDTDAHIVNTASLGGLIPSSSAPYTAAKFAVVGLSETLHQQLRRGNFKPRVSVLCPGFVDTNILHSLRNRPAYHRSAAYPQSDPQRERDIAELRRAGLDPGVVGDRVVDAIRDDRFYVLTHLEANPLIEHRMRDILEGRTPTAESREVVLRRAYAEMLGRQSLIRRAWRKARRLAGR